MDVTRKTKKQTTKPKAATTNARAEAGCVCLETATAAGSDTVRMTGAEAVKLAARLQAAAAACPA